VSVISEATFQCTWDKSETPIFQPSNVKLHTYTGEMITVVGCIQVRVDHNGQSKELQLLVVQGEGPSLLGRDWLWELRLDWGAKHKLGAQDQLQAILDDYSDLFKEELGRIRGVKAKIHVSQKLNPVLQTKSCTLP